MSSAATSSSSAGSLSGRASFHPKRTNGTFRVVSDDCAQFSLDEDFEEDDNDLGPVFVARERHSTPSSKSSNQPLISSGFDNDAGKDKKKDISRTPARGVDKELSRLTDEVEIDGDSASDELDLLPPLPPNSRKLPKWKIPNWLCCKSRVPIKCTVM